MKADWRSSLVAEAIRAFSNDLNLAVAVVTPRPRTVVQQPRVIWGSPPRFVTGLSPLGRTGSQVSTS